jgi:uncharacterized membrane protein YqhA
MLEHIYGRFFQMRYVCLIAVACLFIGAVLMFLSGLMFTLSAVGVGANELRDSLQSHSEGSMMSIAIVQSVDAFLFALVLLIFAYAIYSIFIYNIGSSEREKLPSWLRIGSIGELKTILVQVIIVILAVNLLERIIVTGSKTMEWQTLIIPFSMILLAGALYLMHAGGHTESA